MTSLFAPGTLVYLRPKNYSSPLWASLPVAKRDDAGVAVVLKSIGRDRNDHEYFEVLVNDRLLMAWDDELEKRD